MVRSYWRQVCKRAWQDTLHSASLDSRSRVAWRVLVAIGTVCLVAYFGAASDLRSRLITGLATIGAILIAFATFYIWQFVAAPAKMDKESRSKIAELSDKLDDREKRERVRKKLWELRESGVAIRNDGLSTRTIDSWTAKFEEWHAKVLIQAANLSVDLRHALDPIDKITPESNERVALSNPIHQKNVSVMSEMLARLYKYLDKPRDELGGRTTLADPTKS
jgi:hypothetical protein